MIKSKCLVSILYYSSEWIIELSSPYFHLNIRYKYYTTIIAMFFFSGRKGFSDMSLTSTSSISELRKDFLDRKKVLKSLEGNSFISPQNYVIPARYHTKQHPNVWRILRKWHSIKTYTRNVPGPKSALGPARSPGRPPWTYVDAEIYQEFVFDSFRSHRRR